MTKAKENTNNHKHYGAFRDFLPYILKYKWENSAAVALGLLSGITSVYLTYEIGQVIDQMIGKNEVNFTNLSKIILIFIGLVLLTSVSQWLIQVLGNRVSYLSVGDLRKDTFTKLNSLPLSYYDTHPHGDISSRFTNDMDNISLAVSSIYNQIFSGLAVILLSLVTMLKMNVSLTLVVLTATPVIFLTNWLVAKASQNDFINQQALVGQVSAFVSERVGNQKLIQAFQAEDMDQRTFEKINQDLYVKGQKAQFSSSLTNPLSRFVDHLAYVAVGFVGAYLILIGKSSISVGLISSFTIYASQFTKPFIEISALITPIQTGLVGINRAFAILGENSESSDKNLQVLQDVKGQIIFEDVDFSYRPDKPLIQNFNFQANPGDKIAIVGKTGAGKSTLVNLLMRFYDVDAGSIKIDGHDIRTVTRNSLRRNFGMVLQDTWLIDGSIRDNLIYGNPQASDQEINDVLRETYMYDFVKRLPHGLDTLIGEEGMKISEGQAQLFTIARVMLSHPKMLILDEATSSVDSLTEEKISEAFLKMMVGRTSFIIAHRLATIKSATKIIVMDQGKIVEQGTHAELLKNKGQYYQIYESQFKN
ncbi:ABC transporter ATP-binding protein [Streptococcaceae bacterium ESL0687]|nr:ABC transporter ATP-binding protein [Streptococcaceae bacterium ESL0687]